MLYRVYTGVHVFMFFLYACGTQEVYIDGTNHSEPEENEALRPEENEPASVIGDADLQNGEQIHILSCLSCHPDSAPAFENMIPRVTDLEIETTIRNGKKGVPAALGERAPPDGALRLNLTDQDIIDVIAFVREAYGAYNP